MPKTAILYGYHPDFSDEDFKLDGTFISPWTIGPVEVDPQEYSAILGYRRLCIAVVFGCINDLIWAYHTWPNADEMHLLWERYRDHEKVEDLAEELNKSPAELQAMLDNYEFDWIKHDPIKAFENARIYMESVNIEPIDALLAAKDFVDGTRNLGIDEPDNTSIAMPEMRHTNADYSEKR